MNDWEAKVTAKLRGHPHILPVYDTGHEEGWAYIVSQYMAGGDLKSLCKATTASGEGLPLERCLQVARQVCDALAHAHQERIIHRDVQPANVWFDRPDGSAFLGDFDLAVSLDDKQPIPSELVTTRAYMPPEQALGGPADELGDLYSFGATMYHALTGSPPFVGDEDEIVEQHVNKQPTPPSDVRTEIPFALDMLICNLLHKDPAERPRAASELLDALNAIPASTAPDEFELQRTIASRESTHVELKASLRFAHDPKKQIPPTALEAVVAKTIAAFMNTEGGTLLIGVADDGEILGIEHDFPSLGKDADVDHWERHFRKAMRDSLGHDAASAISLFFVPCDGRTVAVVQSRRRSRETWAKTEKGEVFFVRDGNASLPLSPREAADVIRVRWPTRA